ncbi:MAG: hypothetical protein B6247_27810 [Candidatus Parabeggiatoa sp. nov. 2]|nr:MAG: hypothetical protein B6247_27810 [Beggiatoa sp. 4572_84]
MSYKKLIDDKGLIHYHFSTGLSRGAKNESFTKASRLQPLRGWYFTPYNNNGWTGKNHFSTGFTKASRLQPLRGWCKTHVFHLRIDVTLLLPITNYQTQENCDEFSS